MSNLLKLRNINFNKKEEKEEKYLAKIDNEVKNYA